MLRLVGIALLGLVGCAGSGAERPRAAAPPAAPDAAFEIEADRSAADCEALMADGRLDPLRGKLAVSRVDDQTPAMLASRAVPNPAERRLVQLWSEQRDGCRASTEAALQRLPRQLAALMRSAHGGVQSLAGDLAGGKLTWGEFARRRAAI